VDMTLLAPVQQKTRLPQPEYYGCFDPFLYCPLLCVRCALCKEVAIIGVTSRDGEGERAGPMPPYDCEFYEKISHASSLLKII
jgi:hypothetical protein